MAQPKYVMDYIFYTAIKDSFISLSKEYKIREDYSFYTFEDYVEEAFKLILKVCGIDVKDPPIL